MSNASHSNSHLLTDTHNDISTLVVVVGVAVVVVVVNIDIDIDIDKVLESLPN